MDPLMVLPRQQERSSHAEPRGDSHDVGHHHVGDEDQHHGERHDPLDRVERDTKQKVFLKQHFSRVLLLFHTGTLHSWLCPQDGTNIKVYPSVLANQNKNRVLTVIPQKAAVFFPNLCRNHCHNGMLITAESWVNRGKGGKCVTHVGRESLWMWFSWRVILKKKKCKQEDVQ